MGSRGRSIIVISLLILSISCGGSPTYRSSAVRSGLDKSQTSAPSVYEPSRFNFTLTLDVRDAITGDPLPGANVKYKIEPTIPPGEAISGEGQVDSIGKFVIKRALPAAVISVSGVITKEGYKSSEFDVMFTDPSDSVEVQKIKLYPQRLMTYGHYASCVVNSPYGQFKFSGQLSIHPMSVEYNEYSELVLKLIGDLENLTGIDWNAVKFKLNLYDKQAKSTGSLTFVVRNLGNSKQVEKYWLMTKLLLQGKVKNLDIEHYEILFDSGIPAREIRQETKKNYALELKIFTFQRVSQRHVEVKGLVKNISNSKLENVMAVACFYASDGTFITYDKAFIEFNPILPGQTSPFRVLATYNPAMARVEIQFKFSTGEPIPTLYPYELEDQDQ